MYEPKGYAARKTYGVKWRGRGYIHLTGKSNYRLYGVAGNPDLAAEPDRAADIAVAFMNPNALEPYIPKNGEPDFINARRVVNGVDRAKLIAGYAEKYQEALKKCGYSAKGK